MGMSKNEMYRTSLRNITDSMPAGYFQKHPDFMKEIGSSLTAGSVTETESFSIYGKEQKVIYSSGKLPVDQSLLKQADKKHKAYKIYEKSGHYYLRTVSYTVLAINVSGYYLETTTDITDIYHMRQEMTKMYHSIILIVLLGCMILSLVLSYFLTYRVRTLSASTRAFALGDLDRRAVVRGHDEIATLSEDFNQMADHLQQKIQELSEHAKNQENFTAAFAHELKTPLTSIIGYAELLRSMSLSPEESIESANYIYSQGKRLESLSYKLMDLFVLRQQTISFDPISVPSLGDTLQKLTYANLQKKQQQLQVDLQPGTIYGDQELVLSLLVNLIDNARKASDTGQSVYVTGTATANGYRICIRDEGKGMPPEEIPNITKPFYMIDKSRSRKEGGAGLGMTLCHEILRLHKATLEVQSTLGEGTSMIIEWQTPDEERNVDLS